ADADVSGAFEEPWLAGPVQAREVRARHDAELVASGPPVVARRRPLRLGGAQHGALSERADALESAAQEAGDDVRERPAHRSGERQRSALAEALPFRTRSVVHVTLVADEPVVR